MPLEQLGRAVFSARARALRPAATPVEIVSRTEKRRYTEVAFVELLPVYKKDTFKNIIICYVIWETS